MAAKMAWALASTSPTRAISQQPTGRRTDGAAQQALHAVLAGGGGGRPGARRVVAVVQRGQRAARGHHHLPWSGVAQLIDGVGEEADRAAARGALLAQLGVGEGEGGTGGVSEGEGETRGQRTAARRWEASRWGPSSSTVTRERHRAIWPEATADCQALPASQWRSGHAACLPTAAAVGTGHRWRLPAPNPLLLLTCVRYLLGCIQHSNTPCAKVHWSPRLQVPCGVGTNRRGEAQPARL